MSLFPCRECGCVENTACCNYWSRAADEQPLLCSECDPAINAWHGRFAKRSAAGMLVDTSGCLWSVESSVPHHHEILGTVADNGPLNQKGTTHD
ncbi:MAG: hypothetical protein V4631_22045 [Pseudomonadota bacterium]